MGQKFSFLLHTLKSRQATQNFDEKKLRLSLQMERLITLLSEQGNLVIRLSPIETRFLDHISNT